MSRDTATNKASIHIDRTRIDQTEYISLSIEDRRTTAKELMDYLLEVSKRFTENGK